MFKLLFAVVLMSQLVYSKTLSATYEVSFGVFQKLGIADTTFQVNDDDTYVIRVEAKTLGLAKVLSNNRIEVYESKGIIRNGKLIPAVYTSMRKTSSKKSMKTYTFDHPNRVVWKESIKSSDAGVNKSREENEFYAQEDILSLFFNLKNYTKKRENSYFNAIGGNKEDGRIDVVFPRNEELAKLKETLGMKEGEFLKVILNDKIFSSAKGELLINLDREGLCEKAILEDVLLFGDIVGKRIR